MIDKKLMKTFVFYEDKCFFVSTNNRESSSMYGGIYAETFVFEFDWNTNTKGVWLDQGEAGEGSLRTHNMFCENLYKYGKTSLEEED